MAPNSADMARAPVVRTRRQDPEARAANARSARPAELVVGFGPFDHKAMVRVDGTRRCEDGVRPQHQFGIARLAREGDAAPDEIAAEPMASRRRVDIKQAQPRHRVRLRHEKDAAEQFAVPFGDPALLAAILKVAERNGLRFVCGDEHIIVADLGRAGTSIARWRWRPVHTPSGIFSAMILAPNFGRALHRLGIELVAVGAPGTTGTSSSSVC